MQPNRHANASAVVRNFLFKNKLQTLTQRKTSITVGVGLSIRRQVKVLFLVGLCKAIIYSRPYNSSGYMFISTVTLTFDLWSPNMARLRSDHK